jgi:hypothetical protein
VGLQNPDKVGHAGAVALLSRVRRRRIFIGVLTAFPNPINNGHQSHRDLLILLQEQ